MNRPNITSTKDATNKGVKILVHGQSGIGKTCLCATLPNPIILSAESGLLSLRHLDIPVIEIKTFEELWDAYNWLLTDEASQFESVCLDSVSEIAEVVLANAMNVNKDGRAAYGDLNKIMVQGIKAFRDLPGKNVYFSAKQERINDNGRLLYGPYFPGQKLGQGVPYDFDEVFCYQIVQDNDGNPQRALLTQPDGISSAKDRSGALGRYEEPDLGKIIRKIKGETDG